LAAPALPGAETRWRERLDGAVAGSLRRHRRIRGAAVRQRKSAGRNSDPIVDSPKTSLPSRLWSSPMWVLLLVPFIGLLWVPFYNFQEPALFGFPFFYWYQLVWVPISSLLIWLVYRSRTPDETR